MKDAFQRISDVLLHMGADEPEPGQAVYVSYSTPDADFATKMAQDLQKRGIATWVATLNVRVAENWRDAHKAMRRSGNEVYDLLA